MTQFHEGQEVTAKHCDGYFREAKILRRVTYTAPSTYEVQFSDGSKAKHSGARIRPAHTEKDYDPEGINQAIRDQLKNQP